MTVCVESCESRQPGMLSLDVTVRKTARVLRTQVWMRARSLMEPS